MKTLKSYILGFAAMAALTVGFSACQDDIDAPRIDVPSSDLTPNTTLLELKKQFFNTATNYADSIYDPDDADHRYIIKGRVISSDEDGNVFKSLVIQDETAALAFSVDRYNLYLNYRPGQEIVMDVTGLHIGKYAGLQQIGRKSWYENGNTWQVSFMAPAFFEDRAELNGEPSRKMIDTLTVNTIADLTSVPYTLKGTEFEGETNKDIITAMWQSQLVRFKNVYFEEGGKRTFSKYHTSENSEQNATLVDRTGNTIIVRTSGYCTFYNQLLPVGNIDLVGILSYYNGAWQIIMIDGEGVMSAKEVGTKEKPYKVTEAIDDINKAVPANDVWVSGYIVGALQPEVTEVGSNSDIQWEAPTLLGNNLIIAETPTETDYTKCMVVALPSGSDFQKYGNLRDNAANLGKAILVKGNLGSAYAMAAVNDNTGKADAFEIEGVTVPVTPVEPGKGVTIDATQLSPTEPTTIDGYTVSMAQGTGGNAPVLHAGTSAIRLYNGNTMTVAGAGLKTIKFVLASDASFRYTTVKCSTGTIEPAQAVGDTEFTWVGDATEVTFTVDADATLGSDGPEKRGQIRFKQLVINGGAGSGTVTPPTGGDGSGATIKATQLSPTEPTTIDGYTIAMDKATGGNAPVLHAGTSAIRLYNGNTLTVAGNGLKTIKFVLASDAGFRYTTVQCSTGKIEPAQATGDTEFTWVGDATEVTFTVDADATLGSDGPEKRGQIRFTELVINGGAGSGTVTPPTGGSDVNISATQLSPTEPTTIDGYTITMDKATGGNAPVLHAGTSAIRLYNGNTINIKGGTMTAIKFTLASDAGFRYTTVQCSTGKIEPAQATGDTEFTWVGSASDVTFTVDADATLGSDGPSKRGQIRFTAIGITAAK
ncbi:MAG: DUF5689 domain-containing protein [Muribaculaceae bacterium]|nr:DUF5689 domain-containing protein [Muribaculaceae bacterium]